MQIQVNLRWSIRPSLAFKNGMRNKADILLSSFSVINYLDLLMIYLDIDRESVLKDTLSTKDPYLDVANDVKFLDNFYRMNVLDLYIGVRTVRLLSSHSYHLVDCYAITINVSGTSTTGDLRLYGAKTFWLMVVLLP